MNDKIRCGDHVLHKPSGEKWVVAFADYDKNDLSPCGWPETLARISDCELVKAADDTEHQKVVAAWLKYPDNEPDRRPRNVRRLYASQTPRDNQSR